MKPENIKKILIIVISVCIGLLGGFGFYEANKDKPTQEVIQNAIKEIETYQMSDKEIKELPTTEIKEQTEEQEKATEQEATEKEGFEEQGEIAYNGASEYPNVAVGNYRGLTYYSQIDSRWNNHLYTSVGNRSQTIGTSGCRTYLC